MRSYDLAAFSEMLRDPVRRGSYENALREQVCEGRSLLEIGGGTGYFACFSAKHGASSVVSCDPNPLILLGRQLASANDLDNVSFYSSPVEGIPKDTKFDVILHDMRGNLPMLSGTFEALRHARAHLAKPKCLWLPMRDTIWCALVEDPSVVKVKEPWVSGLGGLKLDSTIRGLQFRVRYQAGPKARHWGAWKLGEFDYASGNYAAIEKELTFSARRSGTSHGICFWFDSQLTNNIKISSSPWLPHSERANIYGVAGCLWEKPIVLNKGQAYLLQIRLSNEGLVSVQLKQDSALGQKRLLGKFDESPSPQHFSKFCPALPESARGPRLGITQKLSQNCPPPQVHQWLMEEHNMTHQEAHRELFECLSFLKVTVDYPQEKLRFRWQNLSVEMQGPSQQLLSQTLDSLSLCPITEREENPVLFKLDHCSYPFGWRYKLQVPRGERLFGDWTDFLKGIREELEWLSSESASESVKVRAKLQGDKLVLVDEESWLQLNESGQVSIIAPEAAWQNLDSIDFGSLPTETLQYRVAKLFSHCKFPQKSNPLAFCRQLLERLEARP